MVLFAGIPLSKSTQSKMRYWDKNPTVEHIKFQRGLFLASKTPLHGRRLYDSVQNYVQNMKSLDFSNFDVRLSTLDTVRPNDSFVTKVSGTDLAEAGLFYFGILDMVSYFPSSYKKEF